MPRLKPPLQAAALALALAACREPVAPITIRIAHESDAISLDPIAIAESATHSMLSNLYEGLVTFDKDMKLVPALATSWSNPDERTWLIQIRKGVRFHDGRVLTASDVKLTFDRIRNGPSSGVKGFLSTIREVDVVDADTVKLRTLRADPLLLNRLTYVLIADDATPQAGTGPYRFVRWERGKVLEVEAFGDYWGGRPPIQHVRFITVEEGEGTLRVLRQGQVDVLRWVPETLVAAVRSIPNVRVAARTGLGTYYLWLNCERREGAARNPFSDRRVRQAVSLAIDRNEIVAKLGGNGAPAHQLIQQGVFGHVSNLSELRFDPEAAKRLLTEAGYPQGFETALAHRSATSIRAVAALARDMLARVGIRVRLENPEWSEVVTRWNAGQLPFFLAGWRFDDGDAYSFMRDCLFTRDTARSFGSYNAGYSNPELDRLIEENSQIFGEAKRLLHYEKLMPFAMEEMPLVPLFTRYDLYAVTGDVRWEPRLDGQILVREISFAAAR